MGKWKKAIKTEDINFVAKKKHWKIGKKFRVVKPKGNIEYGKGDILELDENVKDASTKTCVYMRNKNDDRVTVYWCEVEPYKKKKKKLKTI